MTDLLVQGVVKLQQRKTRIVKLSMQDKDESDADFALDVSEKYLTYPSL